MSFLKFFDYITESHTQSPKFKDFLDNYPNIKFSVDLDSDKKYCESYFYFFRDRIYDVVYEIDKNKKCKLNIDSEHSLIELNEAKIDNSDNLKNIFLINCEISESKLSGCEIEKSKINSSILYNCTIVKSEITDSELRLCYVEEDCTVKGNTKLFQLK